MSARFLVRLLVTVGLLALVATQMDFSSFSAALVSVQLKYALIALGCLLCVRLLMATRMVVVASEFDVELGFGHSVSMIFSSSLAGFVLPGGIGTDVVRGVQLNSLYKDPEFAAASVIVDRFLGVLSILIVGAVALQFIDLPFPWYFDAFVYALLAGVIGLVVVGRPILDALPSRWYTNEGWLGKVLHFTARVLGALRHGQHTVRLMLLSLLIQLFRCLVFLFTFYAFSLNVPAATVFAVVPVLFIFVIAPISVGGLGVREGLLALLLVPQGFALEPLILVGFASHLLEFVASLPGTWFLLRGLQPRSSQAS